jgi:hypothetical protein
VTIRESLKITDNRRAIATGHADQQLSADTLDSVAVTLPLRTP